MKLSIVTINYNNSAGLARTAQSIAIQSEKDFEWVVIDGGSSDGSQDVIEKYKDIIGYWVSEPDGGIYNAMNKGADAAKGDYLLYLNSGDTLYDSDVVRDFYLRSNTEDVIYGGEVGVDGEGRVVWDWAFPEEPLRMSFFWTRCLKHQATFFSRRCFRQFRYDETHKVNSDVALCMTLLYHGYSFAPFHRHIARFDTSGVSSLPRGQEIGNKEFRDTVSHLMPAGMVKDFDDLSSYQNVDIYQMSRKIVESNKLLRMLARVALYPLCKLASLKREKE